MGKIILFGIVVLLLGVLGWNSTRKSKEECFGKSTSEEIDAAIEAISNKIEMAEAEVQAGIISAKKDLEHYNSQLDKYLKIKEKFNNK